MRGAGVRREEKMVSECRMDVLKWGRVGRVLLVLLL